MTSEHKTFKREIQKAAQEIEMYLRRKETKVFNPLK